MKPIMTTPQQSLHGEILLYRPKKGAVSVNVRLQQETVWLTQHQMAQLFGKDVRTVSEHIKNVFKEGELKSSSTIRKFRIVQKEGGRLIERPVDCYNLDLILSVGYRVNSKQGTQFRIWASTVLKQHLIRGYTFDKQKMKEYVTRQKTMKAGRIKELQKFEQAVAMIRAAVDVKQLSGDEAKGLLEVITDYARSWATLQKYDDGNLSIHVRTTKKLRDLEENEAEKAIVALKEQLMKKGEASELFGQEQKEGGLKSILRNLHQTFDGQALYMSLEERAAHLLYFVIKDHPFVDGNKRIGSFLFVLFLKKHGRLVNKYGERTITDAALVAIALLVAQSKPHEKSIMIALVQNLL